MLKKSILSFYMTISLDSLILNSFVTLIHFIILLCSSSLSHGLNSISLMDKVYKNHSAPWRKVLSSYLGDFCNSTEIAMESAMRWLTLQNVLLM